MTTELEAPECSCDYSYTNPRCGAHGADHRSSPTPPLVDAMELFERFWNACSVDGDWTVSYPEDGCECGNCAVCGARNILSWTWALLSNPSLADTAEAKAAERRSRDAGGES